MDGNVIEEKIMKCAFFDMDETLVTCKSMFSFYQYFERKKPRRLLSNFSELIKNITELVEKGATREEINRYYYTQYKGVNQLKVRDSSFKWFENCQDVSYLDIGKRKLKELQAQGWNIVVVSGSMYDIIYPILNDLNIEHSLCTEPEVEYGCYTGNLNTQAIGQGKAKLVQEFCEHRRINLEDCIGVGDHISDIPMLELLGQVFIVNPCGIMQTELKNRRWNALTGA